jgi:hypothetical protein
LFSVLKGQRVRVNGFSAEPQVQGGWNSPAMPLRYVETAKIAIEGVKPE